MCVCSVAQSCLTLCDPVDYNPPGSSVHVILQARIVTWVAMPSSRGSSRPRISSTVQVGSLPPSLWEAQERRQGPKEHKIVSWLRED